MGKRWVVTGGAGFIGSAFVRRAVTEGWAESIVVLDKLTYAGNTSNLRPIAHKPGWQLVRADICRASEAEAIIRADGGTQAIFHFAAESHVDRSIAGARAFVDTNVLGTQVLLDLARAHNVERFMHVSTDEVYGALDLVGQERFVESTPLAPTSPYAASKAASDLMVLAACKTHNLNGVITRCSNNYGPYQNAEKFIPLFISHALAQKKMPLYGDGKNVRDWIFVDDHVLGVHQAYLRGQAGAVYNLGGECERANKDIAIKIASLCGTDANNIVPVIDRLAHDRRYAVDTRFAQRELGFVPGPPIEQRLRDVVDWYRDHLSFCPPVKSSTVDPQPFAQAAAHASLATQPKTARYS